MKLATSDDYCDLATEIFKGHITDCNIQQLIDSLKKEYRHITNYNINTCTKDYVDQRVKKAKKIGAAINMTKYGIGDYSQCETDQQPKDFRSSQKKYPSIITLNYMIKCGINGETQREKYWNKKLDLRPIDIWSDKKWTTKSKIEMMTHILTCSDTLIVTICAVERLIQHMGNTAYNPQMYRKIVNSIKEFIHGKCNQWKIKQLRDLYKLHREKVNYSDDWQLSSAIYKLIYAASICPNWGCRADPFRSLDITRKAYDWKQPQTKELETQLADCLALFDPSHDYHSKVSERND